MRSSSVSPRRPSQSDARDSRNQVAIRPAFVSQISVEAIAGINPRRYLELLPRLGVPVVTLGKLRLVRLDDLEAALMKLSLGTSVPADEVSAQPSSAADVLARIGRRVGGAR